MVRALLAGRKTQTRRLATSPLRRCEVGDRLYVREHWRAPYALDYHVEALGRPLKPSELDPATTGVEYVADGQRELGGKHRQGMHMPRWASRLTLIVEGVRVEPLQAISEVDAIAEGLRWHSVLEAWQAVEQDGWPTFTDPRRSYAGLWQHLHTASGQRWQDNPDVLALTFRVERGNIDRLAT